MMQARRTTETEAQLHHNTSSQRWENRMSLQRCLRDKGERPRIGRSCLLSLGSCRDQIRQAEASSSIVFLAHTEHLLRTHHANSRAITADVPVLGGKHTQVCRGPRISPYVAVEHA